MGLVHFGGNNISFYFYLHLVKLCKLQILLDAAANYWWKNLLLPLGLLYGWFVFFQPYTKPISANLSRTCILWKIKLEYLTNYNKQVNNWN